MQQIQVNGADLMYLASRKIDKQRLPSILVQQAKKFGQFSSKLNKKADRPRDHTSADLNAVIEQENSTSLLKNTSFQRKVELHWKSKIRSKDEGGISGVGGQATTRTQSVSPTA